MDMTYNQVLQMLLSFFQQYGVEYVAGASPDLQYHKAQQYTPGVNCNIRGWDIFNHTQEMNRNDIILRYKENPDNPNAPVFFVLPQAEEQFQHTHPNAVRDAF